MVSSLKKRALCVEHNESTCVVITEALSAHGYDVVVARSVIEGWDKARAEHFDLYLLGLRFHVGSGLVLCRRIREIEAHAPIIMISSASPRYFKRLAERAGAQAFLSMPVDARVLIETVARLAGDVRHQDAEQDLKKSVVSKHGMGKKAGKT